MANEIPSLLSRINGPILITGHTGFKGTWLTLLLEALDIEVVGYSLKPEAESLYSRLNRQGEIVEIYDDICDIETLDNFARNTKVTSIIHLAAQPLVLDSYRNPLITFQTNAMGTANVLEVARKNKLINCVVAATTDKVYRNDNQGRRFIESDPLGGKDPYSASKVGAESAISAWQHLSYIEDGPKIISVRAGNVIGGGDWAKNRLLPDLIRGFSKEENVVVRNPKSTRPWQHVLDPLIGYLLSLSYGLGGGNIDSFNFGPLEPSLSVKDVVEISSLAWKGQTFIKEEEHQPKSLESSVLELDARRAQNCLSWTPVWKQKDAINRTVDWWYKYLILNGNPLILCREDIEYALNYYLEFKK